MFSGMDPSDPSGKRKTDAVDDSENAFDSDKNSTVRALTAAVKLEKASEIEQAQTSSRLVRNKGVLAHKGKHPLGKNTLKEDKFFHKEKINRISKHRLDRYNLVS